MLDTLISTKISIPPERINLVRRKRLLERLDGCVDKKLCLLSAPAGFGKTTLLLNWAAQQDLPLTWYSLDEGDNDIDRFLMHLLTALDLVFPQLRLVESGTALLQTRGATPRDAILTIVVNELASLQEPLSVVFDDYHLIANSEIHNLIDFILDHAPENIHLIIASRTMPALPLAKLRARDQLIELNETDLRFTREEVAHFLQDVMDLDLSLEDCAALEIRTEGWVTGLQLAALSLEGREDPSEFITSLSGTHRYILDYLADEVFTKLPEALQLFLLRISPLERFNGEICDAVVGDLLQGDWKLGAGLQGEVQDLRSQGLLEFLDDANLFVFPLDHERKWYRFHTLFSEFLQGRLASRYPDEIPEIHRRASEWFSEQGLVAEAIQHAISAGEVDQAADLIAGQVRPLLIRGETSTLIRWIEGLPQGMLLKNPSLDLALAWSILLTDPVAFVSQAQVFMTRLRESLDTNEEDVLGKLRESERGSTEHTLLSEFALLIAFLGRDEGDIGTTIERFNAALDAFPEDDHFIRAFALGGLASSYARIGKLELAESAMAKAAESGRQSGSAYAFIAPKDWEATMQGLQGRLNQAQETYHAVINYISERGIEGLPLTGHVYVGLADILYEKNELEGALENVEEGIRRGEQVKDADAIREGYLILARVQEARGDEGGFRNALRRGLQVAQNIPSPTCLQETQAWEAIFRLWRGDISFAATWASNRGLGGAFDLKTVDDRQDIERKAFARLLLAQAKNYEAQLVLESLLQWTELSGMLRSTIEVLALLSLAFHAEGKKDQALQTLARALLMAEPEGYVRTFVDCGPRMAALLQNAAAQGHSPEYVKRLVQAFGEDLSQDTPVEPLTERELDVLRLVADGMTNAEIAAELVVAQSTVKTHINRLYSKLGVTRRTQAVVRARELGLIR